MSDQPGAPDDPPPDFRFAAGRPRWRFAETATRWQMRAGRRRWLITAPPDRRS